MLVLATPVRRHVFIVRRTTFEFCTKYFITVCRDLPIMNTNLSPLKLRFIVLKKEAIKATP